MAPGTVVPLVKPAASSVRLQRSITPLSSKINITATTPAVQKKDTPRSRRYEVPSDRASDSGLSDQGDSEAETERLHISPQKQRPRMVVQHSNTTPGATTMAVEIPYIKEVISDQNDETIGHESRSPTVRSVNKKRKRDDKEAIICRTPPEDTEDKPIALSPPKKRHHLPADFRETGRMSADVAQTNTDHISTNTRSKPTECTQDKKKNHPTGVPPTEKIKGNRESLGLQPDSLLLNDTVEILPAPAEENADFGEVTREEDEGLYQQMLLKMWRI